MCTLEVRIMRILGITDIHGRIEFVQKLVERVKNETFDAMMVAGDITHFQGREKAVRVLKPLLSLGIPLVAVFGNCDGEDIPDLLNELGINAHNRRVEIRGVGIVGIGGSNITPFTTIWELSEEEIAEILRKNYQPGDLILSHVPPYGTKTDRVHSGAHVGSTALREFIEENQPPLVLTGHIHEGRSIDKIGKTLVVNPGPLFRGYYAVIELKKEEAEAELRKL
jgi:putative phosphoesterase